MAAAADSATGTLTLSASEAVEAGNRPLNMQDHSAVNVGKIWGSSSLEPEVKAILVVSEATGTYCRNE